MTTHWLEAYKTQAKAAAEHYARASREEKRKCVIAEIKKLAEGEAKKLYPGRRVACAFKGKSKFFPSEGQWIIYQAEGGRFNIHVVPLGIGPDYVGPPPNPWEVWEEGEINKLEEVIWTE
jgi:hypothetical protein